MAGDLPLRGRSRRVFSGEVFFLLVFEIWPKTFGVEAKNDEDALQARRHGLMKGGGGRKAIGPRDQTDHAVRETWSSCLRYRKQFNVI